MKDKKYPFTIPSNGIDYFKKYHENFDKCLHVAFSGDKIAAKGKVLNVAMPQNGRNGNKGIIVTVEYKTIDNSVKIGEYYMDFPNNYPGINDQVDIYYLDNDYDFIYIDERQYFDESITLDSKEKIETFFNEVRVPFINIIISIMVSLIAVIALNKYLLLASTLLLPFLVIPSCKKTQNPILLLFIVPFLITIVGLLKYSFDNIYNADYIIYLAFALKLFYVIFFVNMVKKKNKKEKTK